MSGTFACIAGGGTAGHLLPGLAVADALVAAGHPRESIHFVGGERGPEATTVPAAGYPLTVLPGRGVPRKLSLASVKAALGIVRGIASGVTLVHRLRPQVVIVLGGYAAVPCVIGAILWRVPMVIMEQNARAGAANRLAGPFAKAAAVPFAETDLRRAVVTGNPVRPEILAVQRPSDTPAARRRLDLPEDRTVIAVFSGSLGSRRINDATRGLAQRWAGRGDVAIHHVVGARDWDAELATPAVSDLSRSGSRGARRPGGPLLPAGALRGPHARPVGRGRCGRVPGRRLDGGGTGAGGSGSHPGAAPDRHPRPPERQRRGVGAGRARR